MSIRKFYPPRWWPLLAWGGDVRLAGREGAAAERRDKELELLAAARFDSLILPALSDGALRFESQSCRERARGGRLPWSRKEFRQGEPFPETVLKARERGLRPWAQIELLTGGRVDLPAPCLARMRPRWTQRNALGRPSPIGADTERLFLCPNFPEVPRLFSDIAVETVLRHPVTALVLDVRALRLPGRPEEGLDCLCFACQEAAQRDLDLELTDLVETGGEKVWREWFDWRRETFTDLARTIRARVWSVRPGVPVFLRALAAPAADSDAPATLPEPAASILRLGLAEGVLLDHPPGARGPGAERCLLEALEALQSMDAIALPLFSAAPSFCGSDSLDRALALGLPGWGLTQHLAQAHETTLPVKVREASSEIPKDAPPDSEAVAGNFAATAAPGAPLECDPFSACLSLLKSLEEVLEGTPLFADARRIRQSLESPGEFAPAASEIHAAAFHLQHLEAVLEHASEASPSEAALARGLISLARRLALQAAALHAQDIYLFTTG